MEFPRKNNSGEDESELREKHSLDDDNFLLISSTPQQSHRNQVMNRRYFNGSQTTINITNESSLDRNFSESNSNVDKAHINTDELFNRLLYPKHRKNAIVEICECIKNDKNNSLNMGYFIFGRPGISAAFCLEIFEHYPYDKRVPLSPASFEIIRSIIGIFQEVIVHSEHRYDLFNSGLLTYLLPYFNVNGQPFDVEHLRAGLLGLYATMSSKFTLDDMEAFFSLSYGCHLPDSDNFSDTNKEEGITNRNGIIDCFSLEDLFTHTLNALSQDTSQASKHMAVILLARLLKLKQQRARLYTNDSLFNQVISNLTHTTRYISCRITPEVQADSMREIHLSNRGEQTIFTQTKMLLQFTIECFEQLIIDPVLCCKSISFLPVELRSNHFVELFLQDQDVQGWLETIWRILG